MCFLCKKYIKLYNGIVTKKMFCKFIKPFLASKKCREQNNIILIKYEKTVSEEKGLVETFRKHFIDIVEDSSGVKPYNVAMENNVSEYNAAMDLTIKIYEKSP